MRIDGSGQIVDESVDDRVGTEIKMFRYGCLWLACHKCGKCQKSVKAMLIMMMMDWTCCDEGALKNIWWGQPKYLCWVDAAGCADSILKVIADDNDADADNADLPWMTNPCWFWKLKAILKATLARRVTKVWAFSPGPQERIEFGIEQLWRCNFWVNANDRGLHGHCQNWKLWKWWWLDKLFQKMMVTLIVKEQIWN